MILIKLEHELPDHRLHGGDYILGLTLKLALQHEYITLLRCEGLP